jgi:hypothetical protein
MDHLYRQGLDKGSSQAHHAYKEDPPTRYEGRDEILTHPIYSYQLYHPYHLSRSYQHRSHNQ